MHLPADLSQVRTYPLHERKNKVIAGRHFGRPVAAGMSVAELLEALPKQLGAAALHGVIDAVVAARRRGKPVVAAIGGHVIKCGLQPVLVGLLEAGAITAIAMNSAASIHDYELSLIAETSEDVGAALHCGEFGMAEETGRDINEAISEGNRRGWGYGYALGNFINEKGNPHRELSLLAYCAERGITATVHAAIGTDIIHQHPRCDGAALGEASFTDFRIFVSVVGTLGDGGVYLNLGSAVILPEVFLKAVSIANNLGFRSDGITTVNIDMQQHYRPLTNVVNRPAAHGTGYAITGHHEIMIPLLAAGILEKLG